MTDDIEEMRKLFLRADSREILEEFVRQRLMTPEQLAKHDAQLEEMQQRWDAMSEEEKKESLSRID